MDNTVQPDDLTPAILELKAQNFDSGISCWAR